MGQYTGCNKGINSVAFDDEDTLLLAAGNDLASRVWGVADFRLRVSQLPVAAEPGGLCTWG